MNEQATFSTERVTEISAKIDQRLRVFLNKFRDVNGVEFADDLRQEAWAKIMTSFHNGTEITEAVVHNCAEGAFHNFRQRDKYQMQDADQLLYPDSIRGDALDQPRGTMVDEPTVGPDQEFAAQIAQITIKICNDEREAAIAMLLFYHQMSQSDIADKLEIDREIVRNVVFRLRTRAKELLGVDIEVSR